MLSFSSLKKFKKKTKILIFKTIPSHWRWKELKLELFRGSGRIVSNDDIWWDEDSVLPSHQHQFVFFSSSSFEICCLSVGTPQILLFLKNKKKTKILINKNKLDGNSIVWISFWRGFYSSLYFAARFYVLILIYSFYLYYFIFNFCPIF